MKNFTSCFYVLLTMFLLLSCSTLKTSEIGKGNSQQAKETIKYLALGDSYTIGESVCDGCRFPEQLKETLATALVSKKITLKIIAKTGWTTTNLLTAIATEKPDTDYDLVSLLIGVNNQYQNKNFAIYEKEFVALVSKTIAFAKGKRKNVIVVSIPDYAYTPYGQSSNKFETITTELAKYNAFAKRYCDQQGIKYVNITDITQQGLKNTKLTATDGLHPSELAYSKFIERIEPVALQIIK